MWLHHVFPVGVIFSLLSALENVAISSRKSASWCDTLVIQLKELRLLWRTQSPLDKQAEQDKQKPSYCASCQDLAQKRRPFTLSASNK